MSKPAKNKVRKTSGKRTIRVIRKDAEISHMLKSSVLQNTTHIKKLAISEKNMAEIKLSRLHQDSKKLRRISSEKFLFKFVSGEEVKTVEKKPLPIRFPGLKFDRLGRYLFREILKSESIKTGLLYDAGIHIKERPALKYNKNKKAIFDIETVTKIALDLESCDNPAKKGLKKFNDLLTEAKLYYGEKKIVPIIVLDIDFEKLSETAKKALRINAVGVLQLDSAASHIDKENIYAYAPLFKYSGYKKVRFVVDKRFIFTNRKSTNLYSVSIDKERYIDLKMGKPFSIEFKRSEQEVFLSVALGHNIKELLERKKLAQTLMSSVITRAIPVFDLSWEPIRIVADQGPDAGKSTWLTPYVFHSFNHVPNGPEIQNPLILLGGFDEEVSTRYDMLYDQIASIQSSGSSDFISDLRSQFDVILLTYQDVGVSIELNARALAYTLRDIIERNQQRDGLVFIGISMGGLVSRMALTGIEKGIFGYFDTTLGNPILDHKVKVWITIDTPHQGAHIPLGLQSLINTLRHFPFNEIQKVLRLLNSTSAKEMLIDHHDTAPDLHSYRTEFYQKLESWGGFPTKVDTTVAVSSGALNYHRVDQAFFETGSHCDPTATTGCVITYDQWVLLMGNIDSVRNNANVMYDTQSNRSGVGGLRILDIIIDFQKDLGLPLFFTANISARAVTDSLYQEVRNVYNPTTSVYSLDFSVNLGEFVSLFLGVDYVSAREFPPGIPYEIYAGSFLPTAETIYDNVKGEFPSTTDTVNNAPHVWMPRHCFVPLISALDVSETYLTSKFQWLFQAHYQKMDTGILAYYVPTECILNGEFSHEYFIDYGALLYPEWYYPYEAPSADGQSWEIKEHKPFDEEDPSSFKGNVKEFYYTGYRPSKFDWVYYHNVNMQHGKIDAGAVAFIMDKITRTLSGALPETSPGGYTPPPSNHTQFRLNVIFFVCDICNTIIPGPPTCANCNVTMAAYDQQRDVFICTTCGNEVPWPMHCGQRMSVST